MGTSQRQAESSGQDSERIEGGDFARGHVAKSLASQRQPVRALPWRLAGTDRPQARHEGGPPKEPWLHMCPDHPGTGGIGGQMQGVAAAPPRQQLLQQIQAGSAGAPSSCLRWPGDSERPSLIGQGARHATRGPHGSKARCPGWAETPEQRLGGEAPALLACPTTPSWPSGQGSG